MDFDEWYDIYVDKVVAEGWTGHIDQDSARVDYDNDISPEEAAKLLLEDLMD